MEDDLFSILSNPDSWNMLFLLLLLSSSLLQTSPGKKTIQMLTHYTYTNALVIPLVPDICHRHHREKFAMRRNCQLEKCLHRVNMKTNLSGGEMWRKICHVEEFLNMRNMETNLFCQSSCCFVAKSLLLPFTLFCRKIYFVHDSCAFAWRKI